MVVLWVMKLTERKVRAPRTIKSETLISGLILVAGQFEYFGTTEWWDPEWQEWSMVSRNNAHNWLYGFTTINISGTPYFFGKSLKAYCLL